MEQLERIGKGREPERRTSGEMKIPGTFVAEWRMLAGWKVAETMALVKRMKVSGMEIVVMKNQHRMKIQCLVHHPVSVGWPDPVHPR